MSKKLEKYPYENHHADCGCGLCLYELRKEFDFNLADFVFILGLILLIGLVVYVF